jgi:hypothetical protein
LNRFFWGGFSNIEIDRSTIKLKTAIPKKC